MTKKDTIAMLIGIYLRDIPDKVNDIYNRLNNFKKPEVIKVTYLKDIQMMIIDIKSQIFRLDKYINGLEGR